jgi:hypothetical protein
MKAKAGRPEKIGSKKEPISKNPTLAELGVDKKERRVSGKARAVAKTPYEGEGNKQPACGAGSYWRFRK